MKTFFSKQKRSWKKNLRKTESAFETLGFLVIAATAARALARLRAPMSIALVERKGDIFETPEAVERGVEYWEIPVRYRFDKLLEGLFMFSIEALDIEDGVRESEALVGYR